MQQEIVDNYKKIDTFQKALDLHQMLSPDKEGVRNIALSKMAAYASKFWEWWEVYVKSPATSTTEKKALDHLYHLANEPDEFLKLYLVDKDEKRKDQLFKRILSVKHPFSELQNLFRAITDENKKRVILEKMLGDATEPAHSEFVYTNATSGSGLRNRARKKNAEFMKTT